MPGRSTPRAMRTAAAPAKLLLVVVVVLAALFATVGVHASNLLPLYGRALVDVELVCRSSTASAPAIYGTSTVSAFRFSFNGDASGSTVDALFPFYAERMTNADSIRTYYSTATDKYVVSDAGGCVHTTGSNVNADEVLLAYGLVSMLQSPLPSNPTSSTARGIAVNNYTTAFNLLIPTTYGGLGTTTTYNTVLLASTQTWTVNLMQVDSTAVSIELTSSSSVESTPINNCLFTFTFFGANMSDALTTLPSTSCTKTSNSALSLQRTRRAQRVSRARRAVQYQNAVMTLADADASSSLANSTSAASSSTNATTTSTTTTSTTTTSTTTTAAPATYSYTMPSFPDYFTANFLVIAPGKKSFYQVREVYDAFSRYSYAKLQFPTRGVAGRVYEYEWFASGWDQMTYYREKFAVPEGEETIDQALREYFFPDQDQCTRVLLGYEMVATTGGTLLLLTASTSPTFVGNQTVRNIPCGVWTAEVNGALVTWYWASEGMVDTSAFQSESIDVDATTDGTLVRMTVSGLGGSPPLFVHHPFFPQGYAFPMEDRWTACSALQPSDSDMSCFGYAATDTYYYIYDITSFVPYVRSDDFLIPAVCSSATISGSIPSFQCKFSGVSGGVAAVLMVLVAVLFTLLSGCCVWCRYSRMVRRQEEELVSLTRELRAMGSYNGTTASNPSG